MKRVDAQVEGKIQRLEKMPGFKPIQMKADPNDPWQIQLSAALTPTPLDAAWNHVKNTLFGKSKDSNKAKNEDDYEYVDGEDDVIPVDDKAGTSGLVNRRAPNNWNSLLESEKEPCDDYQPLAGEPAFCKPRVNEDLEGNYVRSTSPNSFDDEEADAIDRKSVV